MSKDVEASPRSGFAVFRQLLAIELQFGWTRWFGFACVLIWIFGLYWNRSLPFSLPSHFSEPLLSRDLWLASEALALLGAYLLLRRFPELLCNQASRWLCGLTVTIGSGMAVLGALLRASDGIVIAGVVVSGIGSAILIVLWGVTLSERGSQTLLISIGLALVAASFIDFALIYLPLGAQAVCVVLAPVLSSALLVFNAAERESSLVTPFILGAPKIAGDVRTLSWRVVLLPAFVGLAYGLMQQLATRHVLASPYAADARTISAFFLSGAVIILTTAFFSQDRVAQRIYFIALPIMVTAFLALPILTDHVADLQTVFIIGFNCFYFMVWALWSGYRDESASGVARRFVVGLFVLIGSEALGLFLGSFVVRAQTTMNLPISLVSLLVVYALLMDALFTSNLLFAGASRRGGESSAKEAAEESVPAASASEDPLFVQARSVAEEYGLSARELDVLVLLLRGRNKAYISKTLYISDNTTLTHMKHIYRKMGVHSHQQLLDLIERQ
ncbi:MAG: helix-turn-helix transcriptional regulator [Coriobacteriia bacterium]